MSNGRLAEAVISYGKALQSAQAIANYYAFRTADEDETRKEAQVAGELGFRQGQILEKLQRVDEALVAYDVALHMNPQDSDSWVNRGGVLFELGREAEASHSARPHAPATAVPPTTASASRRAATA